MGEDLTAPAASRKVGDPAPYAAAHERILVKNTPRKTGGSTKYGVREVGDAPVRASGKICVFAVLRLVKMCFLLVGAAAKIRRVLVEGLAEIRQSSVGGMGEVGGTRKGGTREKSVTHKNTVAEIYLMLPA